MAIRKKKEKKKKLLKCYGPNLGFYTKKGSPQFMIATFHEMRGPLVKGKMS